MISPTPMMDIVKRNLRAAGIPVSVIQVDFDNTWRDEPDVTVDVRSWSLRGERSRKESFTAPVFRWAFDDGRRFQGRPEVELKRTEWRTLLAGGERVEFDQQAMLHHVFAMIKRSHATGADAE